jgi:Fe-S oxidoreductase
VELKDHRQYAMCCGAGGGLLAVRLSQEVAKKRVKQVMETGADILVTSCPSCMKALGFGIREFDGEVAVRDVRRLVYQAMGKPC